MKKYIVAFLYYTLQLIEKFEYRNRPLNEDDITLKILDSQPLRNTQVWTDTGYEVASEIHRTQPYTVYRLELDNGMTLQCADNHVVYTRAYPHDLQECFVRELRVGESLATRYGYSKVRRIEKLPYKVSMVDVSIDSPNHRYYTNGILSHNTVSAAITILYYVIFNNDKNVMITANIRPTVDEIVSKIKDIYYYLPFFLKPGVSNWNKGQITFGDTNCKIRSTTATKSAGIGFTIDFLYLDEFAHVPNNISENYYRAIFPTISNINNSKIVITSTPNGYNMFWKLLNGALKPVGDKEKNSYKALQIPWWRVNGRYVTYLRLDEFICAKHHIDPQRVFEWVAAMGFEPEILDEKGRVVKEGIKMRFNGMNGKYEISIPNREEYLPAFFKDLEREAEDDMFVSNYFRRLVYEQDSTKIYLREFADISSWKEDAIKDIGSLEAFNQEYDLQFLSGNKLLFNSQIMNKIEHGICQFEYQPIDRLTQRTFIPYDNLRWIQDRADLFELGLAKNYFMSLSVDISEGLGGDFSVINFFRIMLKDEAQWSDNAKSLYDFFRLEQVGLYHSNHTSVQELGELLYLLCFEIFDQDKIGVVVEGNNWGGELQKTMMEIYNGRNDYSNHIFYRYKHRIDAPSASVGIKLRENKNLFVKDYQTRIKMGDIIIHEHQTLQEMTTFIKKETNAGNVKFEADAGAHDDIVMTVVEQSTVFDNVLFHNLVNSYIDTLPDTVRERIDKKLGQSPFVSTVDYSVIRTVNQPVQKNWWDID